MQQPIREIVIDLMLERTPEADQKLQHLFDEDPYARVVYNQEMTNILIEKYLDGSLSEKESKEFQVLREVDPQVKREIKLRSDVNRLTHSLPLITALDEAYENYLDQETEEYQFIKAHLRKKKLARPIRYAVAASIVFMIGLTALLLSYNGNYSQADLYQSYYQPLDEAFENVYSIERGSLEVAKRQYFDSRYNDAYHSFKNLPESIVIKTEKEFFLALSLMELKKYDKASQLLSDVVDNKGYEHVPQAYWYLGLCELQLGNLNEAKSIFEYIVSVQGYNHTQASKILRQL